MARARTGATLLLGLVLAAGCGESSPASPPPPAGPATPSPDASASASPSALPSPVPTTTPSPAPTGADGFSCTSPLQRRATTDGVVAVQVVRVGTHPGYDRVVFELAGSKVPALTLDRVSPPFEKDPSGLPLTVAGAAFVRIRQIYASGGGYASPDGKPTYKGPAVFDPACARLTSLVQAGDFEGHLTWIAGLTGPVCYRVLTLSESTRLVIDILAPLEGLRHPGALDQFLSTSQSR